jgi:hypothetical protein
MMKWMDWEGSGCGLIRMLSWYLPARIEKISLKTSGYPVPRTDFSIQKLFILPAEIICFV